MKKLLQKVLAIGIILVCALGIKAQVTGIFDRGTYTIGSTGYFELIDASNSGTISGNMGSINPSYLLGATYVGGKIEISPNKLRYNFIVTDPSNLQGYQMGCGTLGAIPDFAPTVVVLSITLTSFTASAVGGTVSLRWATANETNFSHFEIERSSNGINWTKIAKTPGKGGGNYQFQDVNPDAGKNFYRLKSVDKNGTFSLSNIASATIEKAKKLTVLNNFAKAEGQRIVVYDPMGRLLKIGFNNLSLEGLPSVLIVKTADGQSAKVFKQ